MGFPGFLHQIDAAVVQKSSTDRLHMELRSSQCLLGVKQSKGGEKSLFVELFASQQDRVDASASVSSCALDASDVAFMMCLLVLLVRLSETGGWGREAPPLTDAACRAVIFFAK